jgi:hypothetical protein
MTIKPYCRRNEKNLYFVFSIRTVAVSRSLDKMEMLIANEDGARKSGGGAFRDQTGGLELQVY